MVSTGRRCTGMTKIKIGSFSDISNFLFLHGIFHDIKLVFRQRQACVKKQILLEPVFYADIHAALRNMNIFFQIIYGGFFQNLIARMPISFAFFIAVIQAVGQKVDFLIMRVKKSGDLFHCVCRNCIIRIQKQDIFPLSRSNTGIARRGDSLVFLRN